MIRKLAIRIAKRYFPLHIEVHTIDLTIPAPEIIEVS